MDYAELVNKEPDVYGLAATLLKEHKELSAMNKELKSESDYYKKEHIRLNFILSKLKCNKFSASSEKTKYIEEPKIFNEAGNIDEDNIENEDEALSTSTDDDKVNSNKKTTGRNKLPETLPNDEEFCDLSPEEKVCTCGCELTHLGDDKYTQLIYIPAKLSRKTYIKHKYACKSCGEVIRTAKAPLQPIPKSIASPSLLTQILISKYRDHLPLYRQEQILKEMDINLARCTLSNWMIKVGKLIQPLINLLRDKLLENNYIQADETTVQVLKEKDKKPSSKSYIWMYKTGYDKDGIAIYEYQPDRKGDNATNFLEGFSGFLQVDGYSGYDALSNQKGISRVGCWAHARRYFVDIAKHNKSGQAEKAVNFIKKLYKIESQIKLLSPEEKVKVREEKSKAIMERLFDWLKQLKPKCPPKSNLYKAINYSLEREESLKIYLNHGTLNIDNNLAENKIRPFVLGRKNWMFMGNVAGANSSCNIYSLMETARMNNHNIRDYFNHVLTEIPKAKKSDDIEKLLPFNIYPEHIKPPDKK